MSSMKTPAALLASLVLLSACVSQPMGPSVAVMPAPGKPFDVFQSDQALCKQYADGQVAGGAQQANNQQVLTGVVGTALGAGLGAAIGGGRGAAIGAGAGALGGTAVGAGPAQQAQYSLQQRYDMAYSQCMYSRGNQVPGFTAAPSYPPPPPGYPSAVYPPSRP
ncbi:MAG: glycine zipper family protein [Acetobacteraceae bacterium]|nr:glycine zipper family protein [Acetobacteraceae bacterium]